jgi:integrase
VKYVAPAIGHLPISDIQLPEIKRVLVPIWSKLRVAEDIRQNLEAVIVWSLDEGHRPEERGNPATKRRLKSSLHAGRPEGRHYPSLSYSEVPRFLVELRQREGAQFRALELIILTAVRAADICGGGKVYSTPMRWQHVDMDSATWEIPDTKTNKSHIVPLPTQAVQLLGRMRRHYGSNDFVFPSTRRTSNGSICSNTIHEIFGEMGYAGRACTHGFRSSFKTWASEETSTDTAIVEVALAHAQGKLDEVYHRGSFLQRRRILMQQWADFLEGREAQVIQLPKRA